MKGTLDTVQCVACAEALSDETTDEHEFSDPEYEGESDVDWDSQKTQTYQMTGKEAEKAWLNGLKPRYWIDIDGNIHRETDLTWK
jgi:hypothetical protein